MLWELKEVMSGVAYVMRTFDIMARTDPPRTHISITRWNSNIPRKSVKLFFQKYRKLDAKGNACPYVWNEKASPDVLKWIEERPDQSNNGSTNYTTQTIISMMKETWSDDIAEYV